MSKTFEEWKNEHRVGADSPAWDYAEAAWATAWTAAQAAMFEHADGELPMAVRVPPVEEWPDKATHIRLTYILDGGGSVTNLLDLPIPRPAPKWVPSKGDTVFMLTDHGAVLTGICGAKLGGPEPEQLYDVVSAGIHITVAGQRLKPFDAAKVVLPWSQL